MKLILKILLVSFSISLAQIVLIPNTLRSIFFENSKNNILKVREKADEICAERILWGTSFQKDSLLSLICEIDKLDD